MVDPKDIIIVSSGGEFDRFDGKKPIAITKVYISFDSAEDLEKCKQAIISSDQALEAKGESNPYDWQLAYAYGNTLYFGVGWYDEKFYEEKKNVFMDIRHGNIFSAFGQSSESINVKHYKLDP